MEEYIHMCIGSEKVIHLHQKDKGGLTSTRPSIAMTCTYRALVKMTANLRLN